MQAGNRGRAASSVSDHEIARFDALAAQWWDPDGPMRPLHRMNRLRVEWTLRQIARHFAHQGTSQAARTLLDLGCGAGLASEALARHGCDVLGVDAAPAAIEAARAHLALFPLSGPSAARLAYRCADAETLVGEGRRFHVIVALEVIEHVNDPGSWLELVARLLAPGGLVILSTLNRTWRSLAAAKIGAEYILRLLPAGTHDWRKFLSPATLDRHAREAGLRVREVSGMVPGPGGWRESRDNSVNYIAALHGA